MLGGAHRILAAARLFAETVLDGLASTRGAPLGRHLRQAQCRRPEHVEGRRPGDFGAGVDRREATGQPEAGKADGRLRGRLRAADILMRATSALGIAWSCRRSAFTVYRALTREGMPARLCFGIRRARPGESHRGSYVGHVWACRGTRQDVEAGRAEFPLMIAYPVGGDTFDKLSVAVPSTSKGGEAAGWRRG